MAGVWILRTHVPNPRIHSPTRQPTHRRRHTTHLAAAAAPGSSSLASVSSNKPSNLAHKPCTRQRVCRGVYACALGARGASGRTRAGGCGGGGVGQVRAQRLPRRWLEACAVRDVAPHAARTHLEHVVCFKLVAHPLHALHGQNARQPACGMRACAAGRGGRGQRGCARCVGALTPPLPPHTQSKQARRGSVAARLCMEVVTLTSSNGPRRIFLLAREKGCSGTGRVGERASRCARQERTHTSAHPPARPPDPLHHREPALLQLVHAQQPAFHAVLQLLALLHQLHVHLP